MSSKILSPITHKDQILVDLDVMGASGQAQLQVQCIRTVFSADGKELPMPRQLPLHPMDSITLLISAMNVLKDQLQALQAKQSAEKNLIVPLV